MKSELQYYNKKMASLHSVYDQQKHALSSKAEAESEKPEYLPALTNRMKRAVKKRNNLISNALHHVSRKIVDWCREHEISDLVIGYNKGWKEDLPFSKSNKQNFRYMPFKQFTEQICCKAKEAGIQVHFTEESFTSKASHLDRDPLPVYGQEKAEEIIFSGKRKKRGLYQSKDGTMIHADLNGAANQIRKLWPDYFIDKEAFFKVESYSFKTRVPREAGKKARMEVQEKENANVEWIIPVYSQRMIYMMARLC